MNIDQSQLTPRQREHYQPPYERHAWTPSGPGLLSHDRCRKCGAWSTAAPRACPVVLAGPPLRMWGYLTYPGGLTVRDDETPRSSGARQR